MYEYSCTVTKVVDGDTIDVVLDLGFSILHKCRVRLYGIDTPESRTKNQDEKVRGKLAEKYEKMLKENFGDVNYQRHREFIKKHNNKLKTDEFVQLIEF